MATIGIFGAGGFGREVMSWVGSTTGHGRNEPVEALFVTTSGGDPVNGYGHLSETEFAALQGPKRYAIALGSSADRAAVDKRLSNIARPETIIAPWHFLGDQTEIGDGAIICPYAAVTSNVRVGRHLHLNMHAVIEHDCVVGDFVTLFPGATVCGNVHIGDGVTLGARSVVRNGSSSKPLVIGAGAIIGMGAVVIRDVPPNATMIGNPARIQ